MIATKPHFTQGSIWKHVIIMTLTNSIGLMSLFLVDLADLYFINLLGKNEITAAVGFSAQLTFYISSISIGFLISIGVLVSKRIGANKIQEARQIATNTLIIGLALSLIISSVFLWQLTPLLHLFGASGETLTYSSLYSHILLPSSVIVTTSMLLSAILRAVGDAKRSMNTTLIGAIVNLCLDPIFIFIFEWGIEGAAFASVISRITMVCYAAYSVIYKYKMLAFPSLKQLREDFFSIIKLASAIVLTNLATPIGSTFVMMKMAQFGTAAIAVYATIGRLIPVVFSVLFSLSGAISPIIGQNFGARNYSRVKEAYKNAIIFSVITVFFVTIIILFSKTYLVNLFNLSGESAELMILFCSGLTIFFIADGILFSTNSVFNSLGYPYFSTVFNYGKFFLGVIPCAYILAYFYGAKGVIIGQSIGTIFIAATAVITCHKIINKVSIR